MKTVLVADDKATSRELVRTVLEKSGYAVVEAGDGIEALRNARESKPDLIILDLHMPGLDGFGVVQEIRRDRRFGGHAGDGADGQRDARRPRTGPFRGIYRLHRQTDPAERAAERSGADVTVEFCMSAMASPALSVLIIDDNVKESGIAVERSGATRPGDSHGFRSRTGDRPGL